MSTLFIRNANFGDVMWTEPIVRYFLAKGEEVLIQTPHPCVFDHYPSNRLSVNCPEKIFPLKDMPIDLCFKEMPKMHFLESLRKKANIMDLELSPPQLHLSLEEKKRKILKPYAILHLDKYDNEQNFRNVYGVNWDEVISHLQLQGIEPIQISKYGKDLVTNWVPTQNFREIMSLIYHCKLFIGLDSGPSHIAASMRIPSVIFFGSVNPEYRHLDRHKKVFLQNSCPFAHCYHTLPLGPSCRLVKKNVNPPCCIHDTTRVIKAIRRLYRS